MARTLNLFSWFTTERSQGIYQSGYIHFRAPAIILCKWAISNHDPSRIGFEFEMVNLTRIVDYGVEWNRVVLKTVFIGCVMMLRKFASIGLAVIALCVSGSSVSAQSWADQLVEPKKIDFGVIATGSESVREIKITNTTNSVVHISGTAPGCQCVMPGAAVAKSPATR
jgi:hypothetical protein